MSKRNSTEGSSGSWAAWLAGGLALFVAAAQVLLFLPQVTASRDLDLYDVFTVDALGLAFGVGWCIVLAPVATQAYRAQGSKGLVLSLLMGTGLLAFAYARSPFVLIAGWVVSGVACGLTFCQAGQRAYARAWLQRAAVAGVVLAGAAALLKWRSFVPPEGGAIEVWQPALTSIVVLACLYGVGCWPFSYLWPVHPDGNLTSPGICALFTLATPYMLAKMLVRAPWEPLGAWLVVLMGLMAALGGAYSVYSARGEEQKKRAAYQALTGVATMSIGLATGSPLAAAGAIWLLLSGLIAVFRIDRKSSYMAPLLLAGLPGLWLVSQGALSTGYGIVAAAAAPVYLFVTIRHGRDEAKGSVQRGWAWWLSLAFAAALLSYSQLPVEAIIKPVVRAMPGGVGALSTLITDPGVGLSVQSSQETLQAALPATGAALALFLAATALFWLKQIAARMAGLPEVIDTNASSEDAQSR